MTLRNEFVEFDGGAHFRNEMGVKTLSNSSGKLGIQMVDKFYKSVTNIKGYTLFRRDRSIGRGGGVCMYIKEVKAYEVSEKCLNSPNVEQIWCVVQLGLEKVVYTERK